MLVVVAHADLACDMVLPNMTGREQAAVVTAAHPETKVLIVSGRAETAVLSREHFLAKPFLFAVLHSKSRELPQQKKQPRSAGAGL